MRSAFRELRLAFLFFFLALPVTFAAGTETSTSSAVQQSGDIVRADKNVDIPPPKSDSAIANRLRRILDTTGWFHGLRVTSQEGVVTLNGQVADASQRDWAVNLAQDGDGVVAVIDKITLEETPWFDLRPTKKEIVSLWKGFFAFLPHLVIALVLLALSVVAYRWLNVFSRRFWTSRITHPELVEAFPRG